MKQLLTGVAVVAALAFSVPAWAQSANPSGGNAMGMPGPNPGGPGLTPHSSGPRTTAAAAPAPAAMSDTSSAMPPSHHAPQRDTARWRRIILAVSEPAGKCRKSVEPSGTRPAPGGRLHSSPAPPPPGMAPGQGGAHMSTHGTVQ